MRINELIQEFTIQTSNEEKDMLSKLQSVKNLDTFMERDQEVINQLVNHLDKLQLMNGKLYKSKAIIRTSIGSERPLHPQFQHVGDYSKSIKAMCPRIHIVKLQNPKNIFKEYKKAINRKDGKSTILVEYGDYYNEK